MWTTISIAKWSEPSSLDLEHRPLGGKWSDITCGFLVRGRRQSVNTSTETRKAWDDDGKVASTDPLGRGVVGEFLPRRVPDRGPFRGMGGPFWSGFDGWACSPAKDSVGNWKKTKTKLLPCCSPIRYCVSCCNEVDKELLRSFCELLMISGGVGSKFERN